MPFTVRGLFQAIQKIEEVLLSGAILLIAGLTIANVFCRAVLNHSLAFTEELCQFLIILVCFVGLSYGASRGRHIRMTAVYDQLGEEPRRILMIIIAGTTSVLLFYLAYLSIAYVHVMYSLGSVSPVLQVPLYLVYLTAPLGLTLAAIQYALTVVRNVRTGKVYLSYDQKDEYEEHVPGEI